MGMFDYIQCEMHLPVRELAHFRLTDFQTKDLECELHLYKIRKDGRLVRISRTQEIEIPASAEEKSVFRRVFSFLVSNKKTKSRQSNKVERLIEVPVDFKGYIDFYDYYIGKRVSFRATLKDGVVTDLVSLDEKGSYQ
ncbi:hypothetical protein [Roseibium sp. M-1]